MKESFNRIKLKNKNTINHQLINQYDLIFSFEK